MWVCLNDAFVSIVATPRVKDHLMVRARRRSHLKNLFPRAKLIITKDADYRYRVVVPKAEVTALLVARVQGLSYTNFKDSVKDDDLHDMYLDMWFEHKKFQDTEPKR
jgi:hypothetical protein